MEKGRHRRERGRMEGKRRELDGCMMKEIDGEEGRERGTKEEEWRVGRVNDGRNKQGERREGRREEESGEGMECGRCGEVGKWWGK